MESIDVRDLPEEDAQLVTFDQHHIVAATMPNALSTIPHGEVYNSGEVFLNVMPAQAGI